jgi:16S rRNA (uracil1498-N3)-methyltransferase
MHRFLVNNIRGDNVVLTDAVQLHHIRDVLRLKVNDEVVVFDNRGHEYKATIISSSKKQVDFKVVPLQKPRVNKISLTVACAIPKGSHMDAIVDGLTQLGVASIIPMQTERVVVKLDSARAEGRLQRWQKIARSAAQQCQRSDIPFISPVTDIKKVITDARSFDLKMMPHLTGGRVLIKDIITRNQPRNIIVLIGPEGDFTPAEVELALHNDFTPISLGDTVLRVETAAIAVAAYIRFALDKYFTVNSST